MDYNLQGFQSLTQALDNLGTDLGNNGVNNLAQAVVNGGLGEPRDLTPIHEFQSFVAAWAAELTVAADEFAAYGHMCQAIVNALTGVDNSAANSLSGQ